MQTAMTDSSDQERAVLAHVLPFVVWVLLMVLPGLHPSWRYALQAVLGAYLFIRFRPWRWYSALKVGHILPAVGVGLVVAAIWIAPELRALGMRWPRVQIAYLKYAVDLVHFGQFPEPLRAAPYAPAVCGWPLSIVRLLGSALVIAVIEEFFWRGFLYRWLQKQTFLGVDLGAFRLGQFCLVVLLFGVEHDRWVVGIVAGVAYGVLLLKTRDIWAVSIAHAVTNLVLGLYVLATGYYAFW